MKRYIASILSVSYFLTSTLSADTTTDSPELNAADASELSSSDTLESTTIDTTAPNGNAPSSINNPPADTPAANTDATVTPDTTAGASTDDVKIVGKASEEATKSASRQQWTNIALAAGAVAVATVAIILVSSNKGSKVSSSSSN